MKGIIDILLERTKDCPDRKIFNFLDFSTEERTVTEVTIDMVFRNAKAMPGNCWTGEQRRETV